MLPPPGLSSVGGKRVEIKFDGGLPSSDGGVLALREVEKRLGVAERIAAYLIDPRKREQVTYSFADIVRFRLLMIAAGYEDAVDANALRGDPMSKMALDATSSQRDLCSQSTISRLENLPGLRALVRMGRAMIGLYRASFASAPERITLDLDDTFDAVHGGQQLALFNAHYDECGFQPIVSSTARGGSSRRFFAPSGTPSGKEIKPFLRRLVRGVRAHWPRVRVLLRADSHYCAPDVLDFCRANGGDYILGVAPTTSLRRHVETSKPRRRRATKMRRFKEFYDGAQSWSRVERVISRRSRSNRPGPRRGRRGQAGKSIRSFKTRLAADRTSCSQATANQFRLFLHAGAYWLMWGLRVSASKRST
jgi:hypothetical protein